MSVWWHRLHCMRYKHIGDFRYVHTSLACSEACASVSIFSLASIANARGAVPTCAAVASQTAVQVRPRECEIQRRVAQGDGIAIVTHLGRKCREVGAGTYSLGTLLWNSRAIGRCFLLSAWELESVGKENSRQSPGSSPQRPSGLVPS